MPRPGRLARIGSTPESYHFQEGWGVLPLGTRGYYYYYYFEDSTITITITITRYYYYY